MTVKVLKTKVIKNPQKLPFKEFTRIFAKVPRLCVDLVVKNNRGIVLIKREIQPARGKWHFPGGGVLFGESLERSVWRVALEEIGTTVIIKRILGVMEFFGDNSIGHGVSIVFLVEPKSVNLKGGFQGYKLGFFKTLPKPMVEEHEEFLKKNNCLKVFS